jgi:hypothetical protein
MRNMAIIIAKKLLRLHCDNRISQEIAQRAGHPIKGNLDFEGRSLSNAAITVSVSVRVFIVLTAS